MKTWVEFFIINNLIFESNQRFKGQMTYGGAVVFSPEFFEDEEVKTVSSIYSENNFFTKELFGVQATIKNLDMHFKEFPYDVFHICTHGGEMDGWTIEQEFIDRFGKKYVVTYDEVISISKGKKLDEVSVQRKLFPRKLNGFDWNSEELKKQKYPSNVLPDMFKVVHRALAKDKNVITSKRIPNSCFIECSDGFYQGMVRFIASHSSPIIFNNSCWSWFEMAESFLMCGVRGYIGTLWNVPNAVAIKFANHFYENVFGKTIIETVYNSSKELHETESENIYIFWGLHFVTLSAQKNKERSRINICKQLQRSHFMWDEN